IELWNELVDGGGDGRSLGEANSDACLTDHLGTQKAASDGDASCRSPGHRLGAPQARVVQAEGRRGPEDSAIRIKVDPPNADVGQPPKGVERKEPRVPEQDEPLKAGSRSREATLTTERPDAIRHD